MNNDQYLNRVIELEKKIALLRDSVATTIGNIDGAFACRKVGLYTDAQALQAIAKAKEELWARKCELFDAVEVN